MVLQEVIPLYYCGLKESILVLRYASVCSKKSMI